MATRRFTDRDAELDRLYRDVAEADLQPLWLLPGLISDSPAIRPRSHLWRGAVVRELAERSGRLVAMSRGGDRRVLSLVNPHLGGRPYATTTLWGALQYLNGREVAPAHRHSPGALRFVLEGNGVWTRVDGDAVAMNRGDLVITPSWVWHEHHNPGDTPMIWFDGLDNPLLESLDALFFQPGENAPVPTEVPNRSRSEKRWGGAGLLPAGERPEGRHSPLLAYRWADTDRVLDDLAKTGGGGPVALRFADPSTGRDVMPTMRCELHRLPAHSCSAARREVGSSIFVVFNGRCRVDLDGVEHDLEEGDVVAIASWTTWTFEADERCDLFRLSDAPVIEAFGLDRVPPGP